MRSLQSVLVFLLFLGCASQSAWNERPYWSEPRARDEQRVQDITEIRLALRRYHEDHHMYPAGNQLVLARPNSDCLSSGGFTSGNGASGNVYLHRVPGREFRYVYTQTDEGRTYRLKFELEKGTEDFPAGVNLAGPLLPYQ